jgi:hypothetical protein
MAISQSRLVSGRRIASLSRNSGKMRLAPAIKGHHIFDILQADDPGVPDHRRQERTSETRESVSKKSNIGTAEIAGRLNIPIRVVASLAFFEYHPQQMAHGQELCRADPDLKLHHAFRRSSVPVFSDSMRSRGAAFFEQRMSEFGKQCRFVNFLCNSGTIHGVSLLHAAVTNQSCLAHVKPLKPRKNVDSARDYCMLFQAVHDQLRRSECELCGMVGDNLQAQVTGAEQFIQNHEDRTMLVARLTCCNHTVNSIFLYSLRTDCPSETQRDPEGIVRILGTRQGRLIVGLRSTRMVHTRRLCIGDLLYFIFLHFPGVTTAVYLAGHEMIFPGMGWCVLSSYLLFSCRTGCNATTAYWLMLFQFQWKRDRNGLSSTTCLATSKRSGNAWA